MLHTVNSHNACNNIILCIVCSLNYIVNVSKCKLTKLKYIYICFLVVYFIFYKFIYVNIYLIYDSKQQIVHMYLNFITTLYKHMYSREKGRRCGFGASQPDSAKCSPTARHSPAQPKKTQETDVDKYSFLTVNSTHYTNTAKKTITLQ